MNKQEAAEFLGVSVRALERYVQQGRIGGHYEKGKTRPTLVFDTAELEAFKAELEQKLYRPAVETTNPDISDTALARLSSNEIVQPELAESERLSALIEALLEHQSQRSSTPAYHKILLTLAEAQELTGLSRPILRQAISKGTLKAQVIGKSWRVKYTDLERYIAEAFLRIPRSHRQYRQSPGEIGQYLPRRHCERTSDIKRSIIALVRLYSGDCLPTLIPERMRCPHT